VAAEAGVSIATVSKVINDRYGVAPDTFSRVKAVIADLGYESSLVARSLRSRRTNVIGILVADIEPFSAELLKGAAQAIRGSDFELIVYSGSGHGKEHSGWERRNVSRLSGTLTDGIILVTPTVDDVGDAGPIVAVDPHAGPSSMPSVHSDNLEGAITATEHLIALGHRDVAFFGDETDNPFGFDSSPLRQEGFAAALAGAGAPLAPERVLLRRHGREPARAAATELLTGRDRPSAVFATSDMQAIGVLEAAQAAGLRVPEDLSVIGFDDVEAATFVRLTTVAQPLRESGALGARMVLRRLAGEEVESLQLDLEVVDRGSTAACRGLGSRK
jgi:LacI family transcriptional regulator